MIVTLDFDKFHRMNRKTQLKDIATLIDGLADDLKHFNFNELRETLEYEKHQNNIDKIKNAVTLLEKINAEFLEVKRINKLN